MTLLFSTLLIAFAIVVNDKVAFIWQKNDNQRMDNATEAPEKSEKMSPNHQESLGWLVNTAGVKVNKLMKEALAPLQLTQGQFAILKTLAESDDINQTEIGKTVDMPGYAMTRNLDALEKRGLLKRHPDAQSRRSFRIRLTPAGQQLAPRLFEITQTVNAAFLEPLTPDEIRQLQRLLQKLCL